MAPGRFQPPIKRVIYHGQSGRSRKLNTDLHPVLGLRMIPDLLLLQPLSIHDIDKYKFSSFATESH
jgi:hypothetical protein